MYKSLTGMPDIIPGAMEEWQRGEARLSLILNTFGYLEIRTPYLEPTELFTRSIGSSTDVVEKEMYTMTDKDGSSISLRPEGTASVVRAYLEHHLEHGSDVTKLYYMGPMFRHERPQKGRLRQFHQAGAEILGTESPMADADLLALGITIVEEFQVTDPRLEINSVGDQNCRPEYRKMLQSFLRTNFKELCDNCKKRVETNPLRVFDCKVETCRAALKGAPLLFDHLCAPCTEHFKAVRTHLDHLGIRYEVNPRIVRGLDYYTRTAFEISAGGLGSQNAVLAGGRYDGLAEELGGKHIPAIGFALGIERLLLSAKKEDPKFPTRIEFIPLSEEGEIEAMKQALALRKVVIGKNIKADVECFPKQDSLKGALRRANNSHTDFVIFLGENEMAKKTAQVKNLADGVQVEIPIDRLTTSLLEKLS